MHSELLYSYLMLIDMVLHDILPVPLVLSLSHLQRYVNYTKRYDINADTNSISKTITHIMMQSTKFKFRA